MNSDFSIQHQQKCFFLNNLNNQQSNKNNNMNIILQLFNSDNKKKGLI